MGLTVYFRVCWLILFSMLSAEGTRFIESRTNEELPNDPYMSYIQWPHLHFGGTFQADVSTVNNYRENFDTDNFNSSNEVGWNPKGSGEWRMDASVTQICYSDGDCVGANSDVDDAKWIVGAAVSDGGLGTSAKLVDIDTDAQIFSEIWGWRIRVGDWFSGDWSPVPFKYIWQKRMSKTLKGMPVLGAVYQSVLSNIKWLSTNPKSKFQQELKAIMKRDKINGTALSVRLSLDMFDPDGSTNNFTIGRIKGTIGLLGSSSPPFFTHGRMLKARLPFLQDAPFYVDKRTKQVFIDFGNSLPISESGSYDTDLLEGLLVAMPLDENPSFNCSDDLLWLGLVLYRSPGWYSNSAGIQAFPPLGILSEDEMKKLQETPLVVAEVNGSWPVLDCKRIVFAEGTQGFDIHPYNKWSFRQYPDDAAEFQLFATKFGEPLRNETISLEKNLCTAGGVFSIDNGKPPLPHDTYSNETDEQGIVTFQIQTKDPGNPRKFIDGQLYFYAFSIKGQRPNFEKICETNFFYLLNFLNVILVWNHYEQPYPEPTWLEHVLPIFQQYANLYPVMTDNFVDLGNYYDVVEQKEGIKITLGLPISNPNHMPVTRDLSPAKRQMLLAWLSQDKPQVGQPTKYYSVESLREDLQTAIELEHATIPPYLTALASIKYNYNPEIQSIIKTIVVQEMMHLALAANILNAVGGSPLLYAKGFIPDYPSRLPGGIQPEMVVPIERLSLGLIRNIFMHIEQPVITQEMKSSFDSTFQFVKKKIREEGNLRKKHNQEMYLNPEPDSCDGREGFDDSCDTGHDPCDETQNVEHFHINNMRRFRQKASLVKDVSMEDHYTLEQNAKPRFPSEHSKFTRNHNTIGGFYHHILQALNVLTDCGKNNSIFTGNPDKQVELSGWSVKGGTMKVVDYDTAVEAIHFIVDQGEGSNPCNPVTWSEENKKALSHYFLFYSIVEKHEIQVLKKKPTVELKSERVLDYSKLCRKVYYFNGTKIPLDPDGVWPMIANPAMTKYTPGSRAYKLAQTFNNAYTKLLKSLQHVFNGNPNDVNHAIGLMFSVQLHLRNLVRTPIDPNGDPDIGPNAGPTFSFTP